MEIGKQIKELRLRRGVTQENLAEAMGCTAQAVSKWEREDTTPDISLLPRLSAYFGVTIDELFAVSDEVRMERIDNMLYTERFLDPKEVKSITDFLLDKARREPGSGKPYELLAAVETHIAHGHMSLAEEYAKQALDREPELRDAHALLVEAMGGRCPDWCESNHHELIEYYKEFLEKNPDCRNAYLWIMDQLLDDQRFDEAKQYCDLFARHSDSNRVPLYRGIIAWYQGRRDEAMRIFEEMDMDGDEAWLKQSNIGDFMARAGEFEKAKACYRRSMELQPKPRYSDAPESIAQICLIQGDIPGAIEALEAELEILAGDWGFSDGEVVDKVRRRINALRAKLKN